MTAPQAAGDYVLKVAREIEARSLVYSLHQVVRSALRPDALSEVGVESVPVALGHNSKEQDADELANLKNNHGTLRYRRYRG